MQQYYLTEITTKDKLVHQGIFYKPFKPGTLATLWVHGLTSTFYGNSRTYELLTEECSKHGWGFAAFNNRGHDFLSGMKRIDKRKKSGYSHAVGGAGYEDFKDSVFDIDAGITFLVSQGFEDIVLIGSSTGANKVCYYAGNYPDKRVKAVVLLSPTSDRLSPGYDPKKRDAELEVMRQLVKLGKGDVPVTGYHFFPLTPKRYLSLFTPGSAEDTFDYGDPHPRLTSFYTIKKPVLIVLGSQDESRDRPVLQIKKIFDSHAGSGRYTSVVIRGASHNYSGHEKELTDVISSWIQTIR